MNQRGQIHCAGGKIHSRRNLTASGPASFLSINILYHDHGLLHAEKLRLKFDRITLSMLLLFVLSLNYIRNHADNNKK